MNPQDHTTAPFGAKVPSSDNNRPPAPLAGSAPPPLIDILLPVKERFSEANAGAISGVVHDLVTSSQTQGCFRVFGNPVNTPFEGIDFAGLAPRRAWLAGRNIGFANAYLHYLKRIDRPDLVEVHGRCHVATHIASHRPDLAVALYLHNDPRDMKGSTTIAERESLLTSMKVVICVSDYIRGCFLDGLTVTPDLASRVKTVRNGVDRWLKAPARKTRTVLLVGRVVPEKGVLECATALASVLMDKPDWNVVIAGARRFENAARDSYETAVAKTLEPLGPRAQMKGFLPQSEIRRLQQEAEVIVCPSQWQEPMGKTVLEALAAGSALLTTRRGGIPETAEGRAHIVDDPTVDNLTSSLERLVTDDDYRATLQRKAWEDFPFTAQKMADDADTVRAAVIHGATNRRP